MKKYEMPEMSVEMIEVEEAILSSGNLAPNSWEAPSASIGIDKIR